MGVILKDNLKRQFCVFSFSFILSHIKCGFNCQLLLQKAHSSALEKSSLSCLQGVDQHYNNVSFFSLSYRGIIGGQIYVLYLVKD